MMNQWLCVLFQSATGYIFGVALDHMLEVREMKLSRQGRALLWALALLPGSICNVFFREQVGSAYLIITLSFAIVTAICWYRGAVWKRIAAMAILYASTVFGELLLVVILVLLSRDVVVVDYTSAFMMIGCFASVLLSMIVISAAVAVWDRLNKSNLSLRHPWHYIGMLFGLSLMIVIVAREEVLISLFDQVSIAVLFIYSCIMITLMFNQSDKEHIQKELSEMTYQTKLEQQHYRHIEEKREEVAKLRHDYSNQLSSSLGLLREGRYTEAEDLLASLLARVQSTKEITYCPIPVVNAILSEKQQECERQGITLSVDLPIPSTVTVAQIDLCSVFGNVLDNAIRACGQLPPDATRAILLTAAVQGDYLIIRCDNPVPEKEEPREGGGYGLKILSEIASRYHGQTEITRENGQFSIRVVLMKGAEDA